MAGAAKRQLRSILLQRLLFVAVQAAVVHGIFVRGRQHIKLRFSFSGSHPLVAFLADFRGQFGMLYGIMAFQATFVPAQFLLVKFVIEDRAGLIEIRMAFRAGAGFIIWQVQVVTNLAFAFACAFIYQPFLVIQMRKIHYVSGIIPVDVQRFPTGCGRDRGWRLAALERQGG